MTRGKWLVGLAVVTGASGRHLGHDAAQSPQGQQQPPARPGREQLPQPVYRVAQQAPDAGAIAANTNGNLPQQPEAAVAQQEHPLVPALQIAYAAMNNIRANIKDYSCTMIKRERIDGKLNEPEFMHLRVRHEPFSVYMYFLGPERLRGPGSHVRGGQEQRQPAGPRRQRHSQGGRHRATCSPPA